MNNRKRMKLKAYITRKNYKVKINKRQKQYMIWVFDGNEL